MENAEISMSKTKCFLKSMNVSIKWMFKKKKKIKYSEYQHQINVKKKLNHEMCQQIYILRVIMIYINKYVLKMS